MTDLANLCRVCLEPERSGCHVSVFQNDSKIALKILLLSGVELRGTIELPSIICLQCAEDLDHAYSFRGKCLKADEYFQSIHSATKDSSSMESTSRSKGDKTCLPNKINAPQRHSKKKTIADAPQDKQTSDSGRRTRRTTRKSSGSKTKVSLSVQETKSKERFFCSKCFKSFCDQNYLKKHEYFRHSEIPVEDLFECDYCGHKTKSKQLVRNHINTVHSTKPREKFICRVCGKMLSTRGNLDGHEKTHLELDLSEYVQCPICEKLFREKRFMVEHKKLVHERSKAFQCPHCPHISTCKGAYNKHFKSVHLKLRDFICTECGLGYSSNSQLTRHIRIHTGERPYDCKNCTKAFRLSSHRKRHEEICPKR